MKFSIVFLGLLLSIQPIFDSVAQRRAPIVSPEFNEDGTITFRYDGPDADSVVISAEFLEEEKPLKKDEASGVWSITLGEIVPDLYPYYFKVDGISVADPSNPDWFPNERFKRSVVDVPGDEPQIHDMMDVPHGKVSYQYYDSKPLGLTRPLVIYTPPGYEKNSDKKYPVLYLIHGMTDTEETWLKVGKINLIMDNLIAQGKSKPMIIVIPYANPFPALVRKDRSIVPDHLRTDLFVDEIMKEIIPFTEKNYRAIPNSANRAIAGFSLGGRQTLAAGLSNPDTFDYVCAFAPAVWKREFDDTFANLYASPSELNSKLQLLWLSVGTSDFLYEAAQDFLAALDAKNIQYKHRYSEGGHTWMNVRDYVTETTQMMFK